MNDNFKPPPQKLENPFLNTVNGIKPPYGFTPSGMLRPRELQPPPMYGPRGSTIPPKFLPKYDKNFKTYNDNRNWNQNRNKDKQNFNNQRDGNTNNKKFYCETCERDFQSRYKFEEHKKDHIRCTVPGCMFKGHPQGLERHIEQQHTSGLFDKIKNLNTPEEIEKWRAERKNRFPSQRNIELRQRAQEERLNRGEKLSKNNSRFAKKSDRERNIKGNKNRRKQENRNRNKREEDPNLIQIEKSAEIIQTDEENDNMNGNLKRFTGTSQLSDYFTQKKASFSGNPLSVLLGMYGSSDDEIDELEEGELFKKDHLPIPRAQTEQESEEELSSGEEPEEIKSEKPTEELVPLTVDVAKPTDNPNPRKRKRKNPNLRKPVAPKKQKSLLDNPRLKCSNQNTMLAKLLEPEIRHERNILLQCVRYVVENNFFGIGDENKT